MANSLVAILQACRSQANAQTRAPAAQANVSAAVAAGGRFAIFDVPGESPSYGPTPAAINNSGEVVGYVIDSAIEEHSFLRAPDGTLTEFDPPAAACSPGSICSTATGISEEGVVTGGFFDASGVGHGYLRTPDGKFQTLDVPGSNNYTNPNSINAAGAVTGTYIGTGELFHGFLRQANGIYTTFDPPGSTYTVPTENNSPGAIAGFYYESIPGWPKAFLRSSDGNIVTFNVPDGAVLAVPPVALNAMGTVTGAFCSDHSCDLVHAFVRAPGGAMTTFDAPGDNALTGATAIDAAGEIAGPYIPSDFSAEHGYLRTVQGTFITFDAPGAFVTLPFAINDAGTVAGNYCDSAGTCHGFVWFQHP
ncbi:hypothetical protein C0Z20_03070 [Trinickia symbiotica]|uniref:Uncharacterized protein n=1 Tax=Trinickia symbiotica TaxID=863227 RepID=A0A2N7XB20_9BURK|nr:hypothetical protein C0Z20_03070 [Trinickia symbiotica]